jgi:predicted secreted protein
MAILTGNNGGISVGGTTVAAVRNFSVELTADTIETTTMGVDVRTYVKGLSSFSGSADIYFDPSEFDGAETTFNPTATNVGASAAIVAVKFYLENNYSSTSDYAFTGDVIVTGYTVNSSMDGMVEASISFQGTGGTTFSTTAV